MNIKRILQTAILCLLPITSVAQNNATDFLGIPVDSPLKEVEKQLRMEGFEETDNGFRGVLYGEPVSVTVLAEDGKVWAITAKDLQFRGEESIKERFNSLIEMFENSKRCFSSSGNFKITEEENLREEIIKGKEYKASFVQAIIDTTITNKAGQVFYLYSQRKSPMYEDSQWPPKELTDFQLTALKYVQEADKQEFLSTTYELNTQLTATKPSETTDEVAAEECEKVKNYILDIEMLLTYTRNVVIELVAYPDRLYKICIFFFSSDSVQNAE